MKTCRQSVPRAVLDKLSCALEYLFIDKENMKARNDSQVGDYWKKKNEKESDKQESYGDNFSGAD